jgi:thiamine-phosphate pyrophosphorylase
VLLVTSRHRLVECAAADHADWPHLLLAQIAGALEGNADLIEVREPDLGASALAAFLRRLFREIPGSAARVVVNDRADVANVTGAAGVHLSERSLELEDVRQLFSSDKKWVMGRSVHDPATAATCRGASYLLAGTVQASGSKPSGWRLLGWTGLAAIVRAAESTPVVAIGGLSAGEALEVRRAGAVGIAGIGCFLPQPGRDIVASVRERVCAVQHALTL